MDKSSLYEPVTKEDVAQERMATAQGKDGTRRNLESGSAPMAARKLASISKASFSIDSILGVKREAVCKSDTDDGFAARALSEQPAKSELQRPLLALGGRDVNAVGYEPHIVTVAPDTFHPRLPINHSSAFERLSQYCKFAKLFKRNYYYFF